MLTVPLSTGRFEGARQKADLAATLLKDLGIAHHNGELIFNEAEKRMRNLNDNGGRVMRGCVIVTWFEKKK